MEISSAGPSDDSIAYVETDPSGRYGRVSCSNLIRFGS